MAKYRKFFVALAGFVLVALDTFFGVSLSFGAEGIAEVLITLGAAVGVWALPNTGA